MSEVAVVPEAFAADEVPAPQPYPEVPEAFAAEGVPAPHLEATAKDNCPWAPFKPRRSTSCYSLDVPNVENRGLKRSFSFAEEAVEPFVVHSAVDLRQPLTSCATEDNLPELCESGDEGHCAMATGIAC